MADTGHGVQVAFDTATNALNLISVTPPQLSAESVPAPHAELAEDSFVPYLPADLIEGGELVARVEVDPDYDPPMTTEVASTILTWPTAPGGSTGATWTFKSQMVGYEPDEVTTGVRMEASIRLKVAGDIAVAAGT